MRKSIIGILMFLSPASEAQVKETAYRSAYYVEKVWSRTRNEHVTVETVKEPSFFVFSEDMIRFWKGGSGKWLSNEWTFEKSEKLSKGAVIDIYNDERGQKIVIDYKNSDILYFHGRDPSTGRYGNLTIYRDCREDPELARAGDSDEGEEKPQKFRLDFTHVSVYDAETDKWSDWKEGDNTFIVNSNANGDIIHITAKGSEKSYRRVSKSVERDRTTGGKGYQVVTAIDENGDKFQFQIFDDVSLGIKMIYGNFMIQFSKL